MYASAVRAGLGNKVCWVEIEGNLMHVARTNSSGSLPQRLPGRNLEGDGVLSVFHGFLTNCRRFQSCKAPLDVAQSPGAHMEHQLRPKSLERSKKHWETGSGNGSRRKRSSPSVFEIIKRIWDPQRWGYVINNFVLRCLYDHARSAQQAARLAGSSVVKSLQSLAWHGCHPHQTHTVQAYSNPRRKDLRTGGLGHVIGEAL